MEAAPTRTATVARKTKETDITVTVSLDGTGKSEISTGVGFFDHMLDQVARHGLFDLTISALGDLHIDDHHTVEDVGIALGQAFQKALGDKRGIKRYADVSIPMDEALTRVAIDISGRPVLVWRVAFSTDKIGTMDTELFQEWFHAFSQNAGMAVHVETFYGSNNHHIAESCFKALARALRSACEIDSRSQGIVPSTKGQLGG